MYVCVCVCVRDRRGRRKKKNVSTLHRKRILRDITNDCRIGIEIFVLILLYTNQDRIHTSIHKNLFHHHIQIRFFRARNENVPLTD